MGGQRWNCCRLSSMWAGRHRGDQGSVLGRVVQASILIHLWSSGRCIILGCWRCELSAGVAISSSWLRLCIWQFQPVGPGHCGHGRVACSPALLVGASCTTWRLTHSPVAGVSDMDEVRMLGLVLGSHLMVASVSGHIESSCAPKSSQCLKCRVVKEPSKCPKQKLFCVRRQHPLLYLAMAWALGERVQRLGCGPKRQHIIQLFVGRMSGTQGLHVTSALLHWIKLRKDAAQVASVTNWEWEMFVEPLSLPHNRPDPGVLLLVPQTSELRRTCFWEGHGAGTIVPPLCHTHEL